TISAILVPPIPTLHQRLLFFLHPPAPTPPYTLSLHDALPIFTRSLPNSGRGPRPAPGAPPPRPPRPPCWSPPGGVDAEAPALPRSEEHTSELQSRGHLVCRLLLEKKKTDRT